MFVSARRIYLRLQKNEIPTRLRDFFWILSESGGLLHHFSEKRGS
jgi:hypothetical protein